MDSTAIETLSVSAVKDSLSICNYLQPFIAENDREPTWDGTVYIYEGAKKNKDNMTGRVSVQVKGKECNDISKDQIKFQVSTADMANYLNDGGVIYFVVYISSDGSKRRIYYTTLLPVRLKMILSNVHGEKSKSIELQAFPSDNYRKATIFLNFYKNKIKQYSYINKEFLSIEDLQESTGIKNLSFSVSGYGYEPGDEIKAILENEIYLYAVMNEIDLPIPIDLVPENLYVQQNISCVISVKEKQYYTYFTRIESIDSITIEIGQSLKLVLKKTKDGRPVKKKAVDFNFNPTSKLHAWVKDMEFFLDAFKVGSFTIDGNVLKLPRFKQKIDISCEEKKLEYHRKILDMLEILNVKEDLDIGELTVQESREINYLVTALIDKKPVCHL